ncbi:Na+/H+ antiporter family protein [Actinopolymorpha cephalotaxi]|uniref:Histidine transporter YuiF (NhaC family) n=1 Tax=Actinopolymorpha cephalotaxi TaxID=504797 RepID=A0A1I3AJ93_9ACTN|nr:Na+/H+ antiporter NhaC family protein [Actinopolymorpha cephalotaxi]NYH82144.1 putative histidine transporter YuiF (NhaC family) [Actinopolymorpha cephalotaxi]SFH49391.1 Na+/H+ antiporter family protein [Actinopolymorpha cephalotaxi]
MSESRPGPPAKSAETDQPTKPGAETDQPTKPGAETGGSNAYAVGLPPARRRICTAIALAGLLASLVLGQVVQAPTLWGLLPILLYAALCLLGLDIVVATVVAVFSGILIAARPPTEVGELLGTSLGDLVTMIGLIIVLGAGVGEVLRVTGVADTIVSAIMRTVGERSRHAVTFGVMLACLVLVASLGTLAGALAIAAPILIPVTARMGFTRSATASMMFVGGCAGLALAPFAGSNVAILSAADVDYLTYLRVGAGPLAVLSIALAMLIVPWMQRRTAARGDDFYTAEEASDDAADTPRNPRAGRATAAFLVLLVVSVVYATVTNAGTAFPLLALPLLGIVTGFAGGLGSVEIAGLMYRGGARLLSIFLLFWLLAALFGIIDQWLKPYDVVLDTFGSQLSHLGAFPFAVAIGLLGWVGVPGATAAQVVLLDKVFGGLGATLGVSASAWVIVLLWASKGDTYGPFPNANMIGAMGLARSRNLRNVLLTGWLVMVPACVMYAILLAFMT